MGASWGLWGRVGTYGGLLQPLGSYGDLRKPMGTYGGRGGMPDNTVSYKYTPTSDSIFKDESEFHGL